MVMLLTNSESTNSVLLGKCSLKACYYVVLSSQVFFNLYTTIIQFRMKVQESVIEDCSTFVGLRGTLELAFSTGFFSPGKKYKYIESSM